MNNSYKRRLKYENIYINDEGKAFCVPVPMWVAKLGTGRIAKLIILKYTPKNQRKYINAINFRKIRKSLNILSQYKGLEIVNVKSKDGSVVNIKI